MIEIITHAYAVALPQFAVHLRAQISSLILHSPTVPVKFTVCCTKDDEAVWAVINDLGPLRIQGDQRRLRAVTMPPENLFRRAIGRNAAALATEADLVWFADCDYVFGVGCLDALWLRYYDPEFPAAMYWPKTVLSHRSHAAGDDYWQQNLNARVTIDIDPNDFAPQQFKKAIGGVQIVPGDFARQHGYLNEQQKWQTSVPTDKPFRDFRDDVRYRKYCAARGGVAGIDLPNLYRLRHSRVTYK